MTFTYGVCKFAGFFFAKNALFLQNFLNVFFTKFSFSFLHRPNIQSINLQYSENYGVKYGVCKNVFQKCNFFRTFSAHFFSY